MLTLNQQNIIKVSLILIIVILILIFFIESFKEPKTINISDISFLDINKPVKIIAKTSNEKLLPQGHLIFRLNQKNNSINSIMFSINKTLSNNNVVAYGRLKSYNRSLQLQINKIKILN